MFAAALVGVLSILTVESSAMTGTISVVRQGPVSVAELRAESGERVKLKGALVAELKRLNSYRVWVSGIRTNGALSVEKYNLLEGGGIRPILGKLVLTPEGFALSDGPGRPTRLSVPPKTRRKLRGQVGATLWVTGRIDEEGVLTVQRYGLIKMQQPDAEPKKTVDADASKGN